LIREIVLIREAAPAKQAGSVGKPGRSDRAAEHADAGRVGGQCEHGDNAGKTTEHDYDEVEATERILASMHQPESGSCKERSCKEPRLA
jgi:hypothetical protein